MKKLPTLLGVVLLVAAGFVVAHEFRHVRPHEILRAVHAIPTRSLVIAAGWTFLSFFVLTFYDLLATRYAGHRIRWARTAFASFCAYVLSHNLGFSALSGGAVRYRLYSAWGLQPAEIARVIAFCSLTFGLGAMAIGGAVAIAEPGSVPVLGTMVPHALIVLVGVALWAAIASYVLLARRIPSIRIGGHVIALPGIGTATKQVALAAADVGATASIAYALLPAAPGLDYTRFLTIYLASYAAGLFATLPGGLGVFDTAMLLGLKHYLPPPTILGAVLVFRLFYYVIPLFVAGILFSAHEVYLRGAPVLFRKRVGPRASTVVRASEADFSVAVSTGLVAIAGAILLAIGVFEPDAAPPWLLPTGPLLLLASGAGAYATSLIGAALMVLAIGLAQRVTLAWGASVVLLLIAAVLCVLEQQPVWIAVSEVVAALVTLPFRNSYYRHARLLAEPLDPGTAVPLIALAGSILAFAMLAPDFRYLDGTSWWQVVMASALPGRLRLSVGLLVVVFLFATWRLIRPGRVAWLEWTDESRRRFASLGADPPDGADGIVMGETGRSCIAFRRAGRVLVGIGDPAGASPDRISAIWRLRDLAVQEGRATAVWRAGPELLDTWFDLGLIAWPLGRDGLPLPGRTDDVASGGFVCVTEEADLATVLRAVGTGDRGPGASPRPSRKGRRSRDG